MLFFSCGSCAVYVAHSTTTPSLRSSMPLLRVAWTTVVVYSSGTPKKTTDKLQLVLNAAVRLVSNTRKYDRGLTYIRRNVLHWLDVTDRVRFRVYASRCSSVSMGWHRTTCLLYATLYPDSLDARTFALRIADSSTFHALHCRRAVFEPSRMLIHLRGTLCPFMSKLLQLSCAILKPYLFSQY